MRFHLSEELEMTRSVVRHFAEKEVAPNAGGRDETEQFERLLFGKMGELGLTGIPIPEQYGGAGSDILTYAVVLESLSQVCASTAAVLAAHTAFSAWPVCRFGSEELKRLYLNEMAGGVKLGACGFPAVSRDRTAKDNGIIATAEDDGFVLNGANSFVINAGAADIYIVYAQVPSIRRKPVLSAFLIESGTPGCYIGNKVRKLGLRSLMTAEIVFEHCMVAKENRIGKEGQGQEIADSVIDIGHIGAAAQAVGIAQGALEAAADYAKERMQFGKQIGRQQGISFKLADMSAKIEAARLLTYQASWRLNEGLSCSKEAAIARKFTADTAVAVAIDAVQVFGGYGYMREYRMERFLRDAKCLETDIGTGGMQTDFIYRILAE